MEFLRFIFSSFWVWLGFMTLITIMFGGVQQTVKACKRERKVEAYRTGDRWHVKIEGASKEDVRTAVMSTVYSAGVTDAEWSSGNDAGEDNHGAER